MLLQREMSLTDIGFGHVWRAILISSHAPPPTEATPLPVWCVLTQAENNISPSQSIELTARLQGSQSRQQLEIDRIFFHLVLCKYYGVL